MLRFVLLSILFAQQILIGIQGTNSFHHHLPRSFVYALVNPPGAVRDLLLRVVKLAKTPTLQEVRGGWTLDFQFGLWWKR